MFTIPLLDPYALGFVISTLSLFILTLCSSMSMVCSRKGLESTLQTFIVKEIGHARMSRNEIMIAPKKAKVPIIPIYLPDILKKLHHISYVQVFYFIPNKPPYLISAMVHCTLDFTYDKCWFCSQTNPSYLVRCGNCRGATIPTRDGSRNKLEWTVFSFGSSAPASERSSFSHFSDAMEVFDTQNRIAIRLGNGKSKYILVQHAQREMALFSAAQDNDKDVRTKSWDKANDEDRMSLLRFVNENLESSEGITSKPDPFESFLIFKLSVGRNFNMFYVVNDFIVFFRKVNKSPVNVKNYSKKTSSRQLHSPSTCAQADSQCPSI
jgi:hypothetical protein